MVDTPDETDLHGFEIPPQGYDSADPTHRELDNTVFEEIDARLELRGTLAERPAATDVPADAKYVVDQGDEQGAVFVENSDSWEKQPAEVTEVLAERTHIGGDGPTAWIRQPDSGDFTTETFDSQQEAVDAVPARDDLSSREGMVFVPGRGVRNPGTSQKEDYDAYREGGLDLDTKGMHFKGSGIHAKLDEDLDNRAALRILNNDTRISDYWVDNRGADSAISVETRETYLSWLNIDRTGDVGIDASGWDMQWVGPGVEVKQGAPAIWVGDYSKIFDVNVEQYFTEKQVVEGVLAGDYSMLSNISVLTDQDHGGDRGFKLSGAGTMAVTCHAGIPSVANDDLTKGPTIGFDIRADNVQLYGCSTEGCQDSVRFSNDVSGCHIYGHFPDGVAEATAGNADGNVINGVGWDSPGSGNTPNAADWWTGAVVRNRDDGAVYELDENNGWSRLTGPLSYTSVASSRALGSWEQAPEHTAIHVSAGIGVDSTDGSRALVRGDVNSSQSVNSVYVEDIATPESADRFSVTFTVPAGEYYQIRDVSDTGTSLSVDTWHETT